MLEILTSILPVFLVVGAGYGAVRAGYLGAEISDPLNTFAVRLAVPILLFNAMARLDFGRAFHLPMLAGFYAGVVICFVLGVMLARIMWNRRPGEAVAVGFTAMFSNTLLLGLPIVERVYGEALRAPALGIIALHAPLVYVLGITTMEFSRRDGKSMADTMKEAIASIFANPLMIGILGGAVFNLTGLGMPGPAQAALDMISAAAIPAALVGMGAALTRYEIKAELSESLMVTAISLLVHPLAALGLAHFVLDLPPDHVRAAVVLAAMPPGMNGYIFATMYDRSVALSASAIVIATATSIVTISIWLYLLEIILPA